MAIGHRDLKPSNVRQPWWFEDPAPHVLNRWSLVHVATGAAFGAAFPGRYLAGFVLHSAYEAVEGRLFPIEQRDASFRNHVGDSLTFLLGVAIGTAARRRRR